jgi:hypothetical protein
MLSLILNPRIKNFHPVSFYIGYEGVLIVEEYDKRSLYPMLIKCHNHLHIMLKFEVGWADLAIEEDRNFDIFVNHFLIW